MKKERVVIICPGRGSYTKETLGYLKKYRSPYGNFLDRMDEKRREAGQPTLTELDEAEVFKASLHTKGEHASALIYACSYADFLNLDREKYEVVAVTGNSMGWYIAMAVAQALDTDGAFDVINTMGSMMKDQIVGGQVIYPVVDEQWRVVDGAVAQVQNVIDQAQQQSGAKAYISIRLGGYVVIGGEQAALDWILKNLPKKENYPFQLINHAAFHTPLLSETSHRAFATLSPELFRRPQIPMVDGRGHIWSEFATDVEALYDYTLGHQVTALYDFTKAISVCLKEFGPDRLILLGPGNTLGGSIGQILIQNHWLDLQNKSDFSERQAKDPFLISLGR